MFNSFAKRGAATLALVLFAASTHAAPYRQSVGGTGGDGTDFAACGLVMQHATLAKLVDAGLGTGCAYVSIDGSGCPVCEAGPIGGGSSIVLDLADDASNESTGVTEIATIGDTNGVCTEPSANKLLIDFTQNWPESDRAVAADTVATATNADNVAKPCAFLSGSSGDVLVQNDGGCTFNPSTNALAITGAFSASNVSGTNTGDDDTPECGDIPALTGDVTTPGGSCATTIANGVVSLAKQANVATSSVFYRKTAGTGAPEVQTLATLKTDLGLTGTNSGDDDTPECADIPAMTGDVTTPGGSCATTIPNNTVTLAKQADMATASVVYRKTAGTGDPEIQTLATLKTDLGLTGTNSGDQTVVDPSWAFPHFIGGDWAGPTTTTWVDLFPSAENTATLPAGMHHFDIEFVMGRTAGATSCTLQFRLDSVSTSVSQYTFDVETKIFTGGGAATTGFVEDTNMIVRGASDPSNTVTISSAVGDASMTYKVHITGLVWLTSTRALTPQIRMSTGSGYTTNVYWGAKWVIGTMPLTQGYID